MVLHHVEAHPHPSARKPCLEFIANRSSLGSLTGFASRLWPLIRSDLGQVADVLAAPGLLRGRPSGLPTAEAGIAIIGQVAICMDLNLGLIRFCKMIRRYRKNFTRLVKTCYCILGSECSPSTQCQPPPPVE